ncbi:PqqD family protein [Anaerococcus sp. AGMB09787]|uniref:PqqD family protein n=1 Tax=Anaerococcus sp. AGMB09787 TaxID=2922869 RepID=UPI001FB041D2|nr:PqqD family protein [Anaerococcus sp. AGMB09787]
MNFEIDQIPVRNTESYFDEEKKIYVLKMYHKGLNHKLAQKFFKKPKYSNIKLDELGSLVWKNINGTNTIEDIAKIIDEKYGQAADPLYKRLFKYLILLEKNKFIVIKKD